MTNRLNLSANRCQLQNLCCKQSSRLAFWAGSERFDFWFTNRNGFLKAHYRAMQQMRTELFPLHHAVEDALRDARCSMVSPQALGTASDLLICVKLALSYDAADWQHPLCCMPNVLRIWLESYSLHGLLRGCNSNLNSDPDIPWDIRIYPDISGSGFNPDSCLVAHCRHDASGDTPPKHTIMKRIFGCHPLCLCLSLLGCYRNFLLPWTKFLEVSSARTGDRERKGTVIWF